jgi:hypothetical protein
MSLQMNVIQGQLAQTCFSSEQQRANAYAQALQVIFPLTASAFNYGINTPDTDQQLLPWFRLNGDGSPDKWYVFVNGFWIAQNPRQAGGESIFFNDTLSNLALYDGGEGNYTINSDGSITPTIAISTTTGPMWQVDTTMQGCVALGVSNTANIQKDAYGNTINQWPQGSNSGEIQHVQTAVQVGVHSHPISVNTITGSNTGTSYPCISANSTTGSSPNVTNFTPGTSVAGGDTINGIANTPVGFNVMNPYRAGFWVQRTARQFYRLN